MNSLQWAFWNRDERRLRAGWRILIQLVLWILLPAVLNRIIGAPIEQTITSLAPDFAPLSGRITLSALTLVAVLFGTWLVVRYIDHRPLTDLGLRLDARWWWDLVFGLVLGALLMTFVFVVELGAGWIAVRETYSVELANIPFAVAITGPIVAFLVVGITEEVLSRGYQLRNLAEGLHLPRIGPTRSVVLAWLISSSLFGMLHVFNPNSTWISTLNLMLAGIFLGLGMVLTGRLGLPIGLHITWNFFQGNVFGFPVSGWNFSSATFIAIDQGGPALWTGGAFGPEAGLIGIVAIVLGCLLTLAWVYWREGNVALYESLAIYRRPRRTDIAVAGQERDDQVVDEPMA